MKTITSKCSVAIPDPFSRIIGAVMENVVARVFPMLDESTRTICIQAAIQAVRSARAAVHDINV